MKTRIIQNSEWKYMVQKKYRYRPFRIDDIEYTCRDGIPLEYWEKSYKKAKIRELELHREYNYKKIYKIIK